MKNLKKDNKGFTLVELIVVIAILGVLMAVLVPQYIQYVEKSRIGTDESYIGEVAHTMELAAAGSEKLYGKEVTVTLTAKTGVIGTITGDVDDTMKTALGEVYPSQPAQVFKSKEYSASDGGHNSAIVLTLTTSGKVTIPKASTKNAIGYYSLTA